MHYTNSLVRTALLLSIAAAASANTVPGPVTLAECTDFTVIDDPSRCSISGNNASASGSLTLFPFVSLTAQSTSGPINPLFNPGAGALVVVNYSFEVTGGNPGDIVPIMVATNLSASASSFSHADGFAETLVHTSFGDTSAVVCTNGLCGTTNTAFNGTLSLFAVSGETGDTIHIAVEAQSGDSPVSEWANASADPYIFIDPSFAGAANYTIDVSTGVGNALPTPTPEPAGTLLLAGGILATVAARRSRRTA